MLFCSCFVNVIGVCHKYDAHIFCTLKKKSFLKQHPSVAVAVVECPVLLDKRHSVYVICFCCSRKTKSHVICLNRVTHANVWALIWGTVFVDLVKCNRKKMTSLYGCLNRKYSIIIYTVYSRNIDLVFYCVNGLLWTQSSCCKLRLSCVDFTGFTQIISFSQKAGFSRHNVSFYPALNRSVCPGPGSRISGQRREKK